MLKLILEELQEDPSYPHRHFVLAKVVLAVFEHAPDVVLQDLLFDDISSGAIFLGF